MNSSFFHVLKIKINVLYKLHAWINDSWFTHLNFSNFREIVWLGLVHEDFDASSEFTEEKMVFGEHHWGPALEGLHDSVHAGVISCKPPLEGSSLNIDTNCNIGTNSRIGACYGIGWWILWNACISLNWCIL